MIAVLFAGCGDDAQAAVDAGRDANIDAPHDAAPPCNRVSLAGAPMVPQVAIAEAPPVAAGGVLADGRYVVTADVIYTGPDGGAGQLPLVNRAVTESVGGVYHYVEHNNMQLADNATSGTYAIRDGAAIDVEQLCPGRVAESFTDFDGTPNQFTLYDRSVPGRVRALTFTRVTPDAGP